MQDVALDHITLDLHDLCEHRGLVDPAPQRTLLPSGQLVVYNGMTTAVRWADQVLKLMSLIDTVL